jgi:hypothetical protein
MECHFSTSWNVDPKMNGETGDAILKQITTGEKVEGFDKTLVQDV